MKVRSTLVSLALAAGSVGSAHAGIVSTGGQFVHIAPPPSLAYGALHTTTHGHAIDEQQNVFFNGPVDRLPNIGVNYTSQNPSVAILNTWVSSHIIHTENSTGDIVGVVTFSDPIIAIIYQNTTLDWSDWNLGNIGTTIYPGGQAGRGFSVSTNGLDTARLLDPYTIYLSLGAGMDQIRVLTAGVPAPGGAAALAVGGVLAGRRRRG